MCIRDRRNIAGVLMAIGAGDRPVEWARAVLEQRDRTQAGVTAPAAGLYLLAVRYPQRFGLPPPPATVPGFISTLEERDSCAKACNPV